MKTALQTPQEERIYSLGTILEAYHEFPRPGRIIRIEYEREYNGALPTEKGRRKTTKRWGKVVKKVKHSDGAYFTVEVIPENRTGKRGRYRLAFQFVDLITGRVKLLEVR